MEAVQPHDLGAGEIGVRIGANWVPIDVYQQFMVELLTPYGQAQNRIKILRSESTGQWNITEKNFDRANVKANTTYGTKRMSAYHILEQTLNQKDVRVFDYIEDEHGNKKPVLNKKETAIARQAGAYQAEVFRVGLERHRPQGTGCAPSTTKPSIPAVPVNTTASISVSRA